MCLLVGGQGQGAGFKPNICASQPLPPGPFLSSPNQRRSPSPSVTWSWILKSRPAWRSCRRDTAKPRRSVTSSPGPGQPSCHSSPDSLLGHPGGVSAERAPFLDNGCLRQALLTVRGRLALSPSPTDQRGSWPRSPGRW